MKSPFPGRARPSSFTLPEVLVAVALMTIMVSFLGTLLASVCAISTSGHQDAENSSNARALLDLMSQELESGVNRSDLTNWISWDGASSTLGFFTRCVGSAVSPAPPSASSYRGLSFVEYTVSRTAAAASLNRGDHACLWSDAPSGSLPLGYPNPAAPAPGPSDVLDGVVLFQVTFLQQDGSYATAYSGTNSIAVGVSLALVDSVALRQLLLSGKVQTLAAALEGNYGGNPTNAVSPQTAWQSAVDTRNVLNGYPLRVKTGLRFFERFVDIPRAGL